MSIKDGFEDFSIRLAMTIQKGHQVLNGEITNLDTPLRGAEWIIIFSGIAHRDVAISCFGGGCF